MEQQSDLRRVSRQYSNFQLSAFLTNHETSGNARWTGVVTMPDGSHGKGFAFFEQNQQLVFSGHEPAQELPIREIDDFARFCVDVNRARI